MAHGIKLCTAFSGIARWKPIRRRSMTSKAPISTHKPRKCSDSSVGQLHGYPSTTLLTHVVSIQS